MRPLVLLVCLLVLGGCMEVDEQWAFDAKGGGSYTLTLAWDADLWRRAREALGATASRALTRRAPVPLRAEQLRDSLEGLEGVKVEELTEGIAANGRRTLALRVTFQSLADLWKWELMARRPMRLSSSKDPDRSDARIARFELRPMRHLPILDEALRLHAMAERDRAVLSDPRGPFATWGLDEDRLSLVWDMVKGPLQKTVYRARVDITGTVRAKNEAPAMGGQSATFELDWNQLKQGPSKRRLSVTWDVPELDTVKGARHLLPATPR